MQTWLLIGGLALGVLVIFWLLAVLSLRDVPAGEIRLVSWLQGSIVIYRGPGKSKEMLLLTTGTTIPSRAFQVNLDVTQETGDSDESAKPRGIEVQVRASAIVTVGDSDAMIRTAARLFFSNPEATRSSMLAELMSSAGRRAISLLQHDDLFSAKTTPTPPEVQDDALTGLWRKMCDRDLTGLGLSLSSLHVNTVRSHRAEARRRQAVAEAQANADVAAAMQGRRAREAALDAERAISDRERELEEVRAANAGLIAQASGKRQEVQAKANAEKVRVEAQAAADALRGAQFGLALNEAIRITKIAATQTDGLRKVNDAVREGGETYFRYRLAEMLPQIAPAMVNALAESKAAAASDGGDGAPGPGVSGLISLIQSVLAEQSGARNDTLPLAQADGVAKALAVRPAAPPTELPTQPEAQIENRAVELRVRTPSSQRRGVSVRKR